MTNHLFDQLFSHVNPDQRFAETEDGTTYLYQDVLNESARMANALVGYGVAPGDRVVAQVQKSMDAVMLYLGCVRAGAIYMPLNTGYTLGEVEYFLDDATPALFICEPEKQASYLPLTQQRNIKIDTLDTPQFGTKTDNDSNATGLLQVRDQASTDFSNAERSENDLAAMLYTSGTTGKPKGAMLTHGNLYSNAQILKQHWQFDKSDVLLHALPIFHTHGLFVAINTTIVASSSMLFLSAFQIDKVIDCLPRSTVMMGVPTFYTRMLQDNRLTQSLVSHMRLFVSGSAPLLAETHVEFNQRTGQTILERYGMTETNMNTSNPYNGERRPGTVGFALPGVDLKVNKPETDEELPQGETGMIEVRGPNVFKGYWNLPEKTKEELRPNGFFITGDLGKIDEDGYVHIIGRGKDLIISGGFNVYPKEVELVLDDMDGVLESAVIGIPHDDFGEAVVAILVASNDNPPNAEQVKQAAEHKLAKFKLPKQVHYVDALPRNTMGKVQKNILREQFS